MSAFAVCLHADGSSVAATTMSTLGTALANRGALRWWSDGAIALGGTSPPLVADDAIVVCDGRIDNADELGAAWGLDPALRSDSRIVAEAYRRLGENCARVLFGEFAFVIWDRTARRLICVRDQFGVRSFHHHLSKTGFVAASTVAALVALPWIGTELSETGVADYLAGITVDAETTMYAAVRRLAPATLMVVERGAATCHAYWHLEVGEPDDGRDAGPRFRALFEEAVRCRMARPGKIGVLLSGGLDSSSIAAVAVRQRKGDGRPDLTSLSMTFDAQPHWNERPFIDAVLAGGGLDPVFLNYCEDDFMASLVALLDEQAQPVLAYNAGISRRLYHAAADAGVDVLLDGHGGDEIVSHGQGRLNELAQDRRWRALWREARGIAAMRGDATWRIAAPYTMHNPLVRAAGRRWRRWWPGAQGPSSGTSATNLASPALAEAVGLAERQHSAQRPLFAHDTERDLHLATVTSPGGGHAFDVLGNMSAAAGVESSYPFYDRRIVEFCVALPSDAKLRDGQPRRVLRDAMAGILPEQVRLRPDKFDFAGQLALRITATLPVIRAMIAGGGVLGDFLNIPVAEAMLDRIELSGRAADTQDLFGAWRVLVLGLWLARRHDAG